MIELAPYMSREKRTIKDFIFAMKKITSNAFYFFIVYSECRNVEKLKVLMGKLSNWIKNDEKLSIDLKAE